ncbi:MAG: thioredoxin domain-containing protein [Myxococcaceae bacterium]
MNLPNRPLLSAALLAVITTSLALTGCNKEKSAAVTPKVQGGDQVVATYSGKTITMNDLENKAADQLYEVRQQTLDQMIIEDLVQGEAKKRGMTEEQLLKAEISDKVPPPPEDQMQQFFQQLQAQGQLPPGATFESMKDRLAAAMTRPQQQQRAAAFFEELRKQANVDVKLQPPKKEVAATGPSKGPENAPITIVEFSDFQCPFCSRVIETVDQVMEAYPGKVRLVFRHFPLDFHQDAPKAAEASMCANEQGKFWEYHDALFKNQQNLKEEGLKQQAQAVGLDAAKFEQCLTSGKYAEQVKKDMEAGKQVGVTGTPAFFINGRQLSGAVPFEEFKKVIDSELGTQKG